MLHLYEGGNSELKYTKWRLPKGVRKHLKLTLKNYDGDKTVEGYKRLNNLLNMDYIKYQEMKRIKNFFDTYNGTDKSIEYILNGGEPMMLWVNNTLNNAVNSIEQRKQHMKDAGIDNSFRREHEKNRQSKGPSNPTQVKFKLDKDVNKKVSKGDELKFESIEKNTIVLTENQLKEVKQRLFINKNKK